MYNICINIQLNTFHLYICIYSIHMIYVMCIFDRVCKKDVRRIASSRRLKTRSFLHAGACTKRASISADTSHDIFLPSIGEDLRFDSSQRPAERQCFEGDVRAMRKGLAATGLLHRRFTTIFEILYTITHPPSHPYLSDLFLLRYIHIHFLIDLAGRKKLQVLFSFFSLSHFSTTNNNRFYIYIYIFWSLMTRPLLFARFSLIWLLAPACAVQTFPIVATTCMWFALSCH